MDTTPDLKAIVDRVWQRDPSLWKDDPAHAKIIANSLGWLDVAAGVRVRVDELTAFGERLRDEGIRYVVLMGMGGSSLCPEVFRRTFGTIPGSPELLVLDSTVPATVRRIEEAIDFDRTLFIVASKSGTTIEPSVFYAYFYDQMKRRKGDQAGAHFAAITDPGTRMDADAQRDRFAHVFRNPADIGGRYSALSLFGMVPAAAMGLDVAQLLDRALAMVDRCGPDAPTDQNPGLRLGTTLAAWSAAGRDKLTIVAPEPLDGLGLWIEQLIAESTGKEGKGILPVAGEPLGRPESYGTDRAFVLIRTAETSAPPELAAIEAAGHPVLELLLDGPLDLGAEFYRWEFATAVAGKLLGINPFDQPNVQESKENTVALLDEYRSRGRLAALPTAAREEGLTLSGDAAYLGRLGLSVEGDLVGHLRAHLRTIRPGDYLAITQYFDETPGRDRVLAGIRSALRDALNVATTTGYGPRFLHSTGQFHKGGPDSGVYLQLTASDGEDVPIPPGPATGEAPLGFATLAAAQALGDFQSLASRGRRALRVDLGADVDAGLAALARALGEAVH